MSFENHAEISETIHLRNKRSDSHPDQEPRTPIRKTSNRFKIQKKRENSLSESSELTEENVSFSACFFYPEEDFGSEQTQPKYLSNARDNAFRGPA